MTWHTWIAIWLVGAATTLARHVHVGRKELAAVAPELTAAQRWGVAAIYLGLALTLWPFLMLAMVSAWIGGALGIFGKDSDE